MTWNKVEKRCWDPSRIPKLAVYDPTAHKSLFLAAHTPFPLRVSSSGHSTGDGSIIEEPELVEMFYGDPNPDGAALYAVLGNPGTGKSQLIRLIDLLRDRSKANQHVVYIPKRKTDLRGALELILEGLVGADYEALREELVGAVSQYSDPLDAERRFWNEIGLVLQSAVEGTNVPEMQALKDLLPLLTDVVVDAHFERFALGLGAPRRIIAQVLGVDSDTDDEETGLEFTEEEIDALFAPGKLEPTDMSAAARKSWSSVMARPRRKNVMELLNSYVAIALNRVFWSNRTSLVELMNRLRSLLYRDGRELVLLIEDMSVLSGVQMEFFQALITTVPDEDPTAAIRSMFAITPAFFNTLRETVRQRISKIIEVQSSIGEEEQVAAVEFFARYLNAARISNAELNALDIGIQIPNACHLCPEKNKCHEAFGDVNGVGLFPFSRRAFGLLKSTMSREDQVPRKIVGTLFRDFLMTTGDDLASGEFPSAKVFAGFASPIGRTPSAEALVKFEAHFPSDHEKIVRYQRYWAENVDSYNGGNDFLLNAFQLPRPDVSGNVVEIKVTDIEVDEPQLKVQPRRDPFREWMAPNGRLTMDAAREARRTVFDAVCLTLETVYGVQTETTLISGRPNNYGRFFRPDSIVLADSEGGASEGTAAFQTFKIEKHAANVSAIQALVEGKHSDASRLGVHIAWVDSLAETVFERYLTHYGDQKNEIGTLIISSRLFNISREPIGSLENLLGEVSATDQLTSGRSEEWRRYVESLLRDRADAIEKLKELLSNGRRGALTSRVRVASRSEAVNRLVQKSETMLEELVKTEVSDDNKVRLAIRDLLGTASIGDVLPTIRSEIKRLQSELTGQVVPISEIQDLNLTLDQLAEFSATVFSEVDLTTPLEDLLHSLSSVRRSDLQQIRSMIEKLIKALENLTSEANAFAQNRGYPQALLTYVEQQFENFGFRKGS
jgi:type II secretory pathway predicted ATPase ExeA